MAGIEDLKLWRTEPFRSTFQQFYNKPGLEWKEPIQGRWFATEPLYDWLGPETIIKELDTKFPINMYDETGHITVPGEGFTMKNVKSATDLAKEKAILEKWLPYGPDSGPFDQTKITNRLDLEKFREWKRNYFDKIKKTTFGPHQIEALNVPGTDIPESHLVGRYTSNPLVTYPRQKDILNAYLSFETPMTEFEKGVTSRLKRGWPPFNEITPPQEIANKAKINLLESFKQNFRDYDFADVNYVKNRIAGLKLKGIHFPKSKWENIKRIPHKAADIFQRYRAGEPIKSGIPWSTIGRSILNNPLTRFVGGAGNVALGGQALLDIGTGSQHTKNMMTDINRFAGVPVDRQGNVIQSNRVYENLQNVAQRDVLNPNEMRGVTSFDTTRYNPREMNTGGIASLV
jgi:hypothetical protein